jgi:hypothetical protein
VPEKPGLGVEIDMQYLIPGWKSDSKRPALVR